MDIIYSLHKIWCDQIFNGKKPIEFRTKLPKNLKKDTVIYLYETSKNDGCQKIVGECAVDYVINVLSDEGEWPFVGCVPFLEYYFRNVNKNDAVADKYKEVLSKHKNLKNYKYGYILKYAFCEDELSHINKTGELIDTFKITDYNYLQKLFKEYEISEKYMKEVDEWLKKIGFYNNYDETNYKYGIVLKNIKKYKTPLPLSAFKDKNGNIIQKPPQSYMYAKRN